MDFSIKCKSASNKTKMINRNHVNELNEKIVKHWIKVDWSLIILFKL